jgi:GT2 family glycosyltransferase
VPTDAPAGLGEHPATPHPAVGPQLVDAAGTVDPRDHGELRGFRARVAQAAGHSHYRRRDEPVDAAWVSGAACLVERRAFDAVGGFDPGFFLYKEEEDLFLRIRRAGGRVLYLPSVRVRHDGGVVASRAEHMPSSVERFAAKHAPRRRLIAPVHRAVTVWGGRLDRLLGR